MSRARVGWLGMLVLSAAIGAACAGSTGPQAAAPSAAPVVDSARGAASVSAAAAVSPSPPPPNDQPASPAGASEAGLSAESSLKMSVSVHPATRVTPDQAREMYLSFELTNTGAQDVKADLGESVLLVNGKPLKQWASTMAELGPAERAKNLAPNETLRFHFKFARKVVVKPGEYSFEIKLGEKRSDRVVVTVTP